jgi:hypothetical protein
MAAEISLRPEDDRGRKILDELQLLRAGHHLERVLLRRAADLGTPVEDPKRLLFDLEMNLKERGDYRAGAIKAFRILRAQPRRRPKTPISMASIRGSTRSTGLA